MTVVHLHLTLTGSRGFRLSHVSPVSSNAAEIAMTRTSALDCAELASATGATWSNHEHNLNWLNVEMTAENQHCWMLTPEKKRLRSTKPRPETPAARGSMRNFSTSLSAGTASARTVSCWRIRSQGLADCLRCAKLLVCAPLRAPEPPKEAVALCSLQVDIVPACQDAPSKTLSCSAGSLPPCLQICDGRGRRIATASSRGRELEVCL